MLAGTLLIATGKEPDGRAVLVFGSVLLVVSIAEIVVSHRRTARVGWGIGAWAGRLFAIGVWLMMIFAGIKFITR